MDWTVRAVVGLLVVVAIGAVGVAIGAHGVAQLVRWGVWIGAAGTPAMRAAGPVLTQGIVTCAIGAALVVASLRLPLAQAR